MKKILFIMLAVVLALSVGLIGCTAPAQQEEEEEDPYGGVLRIITRTEPQVLGYPAEIGIVDFTMVYPVIETLVRFGEGGSIVPWLASDWEFGSDGKSLTFTLESGIKFHDGSDFNADVVKWNLEEIKANTSMIGAVTSIDVLEPYKVRLNLEEYSHGLLIDLALQAGAMISQAAFEENGIDWVRQNPVGTGPFIFADYERAVSMQLERNPEYWKEGLPYLDGIDWRPITDETVATATLKAGENHMTILTDPNYAIELARYGGFEIYSIAGSIRGVVPDSANPDSVFASKEVREALEYCVDKQSLCDTLGMGFWDPAYQVAVPIYDGYISDLDIREYNPEKAIQLLADAGYAGGFDTEIFCTSKTQPEMVILQSYLADVGINAEISVVDVLSWSTMRKNGWAEGTLLYGVIGPQPVWAVALEKYYCGDRDFVSMERPAGFEQLIYDALVAQSSSEIKDLTEQAVGLAHESAMLLNLMATQFIAVASTAVEDVNVQTWHNRTWTPEIAWLSE